jgi:DNA-directed RNA polymerase specialized sigma24 family protein
VCEAVDKAIENIVDGTPVDWRTVERCAAAEGKSACAADLRIIHDVANFYRLSTYTTYAPVPSNHAPSATEEPTVEVVVGAVQAAKYQAALRQRARAERHAVIGRLELLSSYNDLAAVLGYPYRNARAAATAARRAVTRALKRLAIEMGHV